MLARTNLLLPLLASSARAALQVDLESASSIKAAARQVAYDLMTYYHGNESGQIPGILPGPPPAGDYYWWEGGALWGTMIDYWHYTGDETYNEVTTEAMLFQTGAPQNAYMPRNWTASLGNDDQGFWGMSAMLAAEVNYPNPPVGQPQWLELAQAVFNTQAAPERHDTVCGGGLRWQIPLANTGYDYKNSIANGIFFNLGARLARYTGNQTYSDWAERTWDWMMGVGLMDDEGNVYDGAHTGDNCTDVFKAQFSYNAAVFMQGAAFMYNITTGDAQSTWRDRLTRLMNRTIDVFFYTGPMVEVSCELDDRIMCKTDMLSFKGYAHRWMANTAQLAPFSHDVILGALKTSTAAAARSCAGGDYGRQCGFRWTTGGYDGLTGAGQAMSALAALTSLLVDEDDVGGPVTNGTGGTSRGDADAGRDPNPDLGREVLGPVRIRDRVGAGVLTFLVMMGLVGAMVWMCSEWGEGEGEGKAESLPVVGIATIVGVAVGGRKMGEMGKGKRVMILEK
ncbi:glycosyl hydrolase family 76-domain-containing protein [Bombardia bombarda]|uniref:Mannan endo-1,6-alpha-mannosidase n=1 Tax=Bombardia bombarda TaxID=252184 RepID=A0AA39XNU5_9PEZI|nr:glycosyl hydrolase family 76-domain-containing protein [Bombardia bombarda]